MKMNLLASLNDESLTRIIQLNAYLRSTSFYEMPASTRFHGNHAGGLNEHCLAMFESLCQMTEELDLKWGRPESPYIVAFGHDVCKIDAYMMKDPGWEVLADDGYGNLEVQCRHCGFKHDSKSEYCPKCDAHMGIWVHNHDHPVGHADLSLKMLAEAGIELTDEEKVCIRWHMGAFDDAQNWSNYTEAIRMYPNTLWTHTADMVAAHIMNT